VRRARSGLGDQTAVGVGIIVGAGRGSTSRCYKRTGPVLQPALRFALVQFCRVTGASNVRLLKIRCFAYSYCSTRKHLEHYWSGPVVSHKTASAPPLPPLKLSVVKNRRCKLVESVRIRYQRVMFAGTFIAVKCTSGGARCWRTARVSTVVTESCQVILNMRRKGISSWPLSEAELGPGYLLRTRADRSY
jgi:hypothetical protein